MGLSSFSNILAYGIVKIHTSPFWVGWRWLFIVEGLLTAVLGIIAYIFLVDFPDSPKNKFLTEDEKTMVADRLSAERGIHESYKVTFKSTFMALSDWKLWACTYMYMSAAMGAYAFSFFLPLILKKSLGYSQVLALCLSTPPALFAVIFSLITAKLSDKLQMRGPFIVFQGVIAVTGLAMTGYLKSAPAR